MLTKIHKDRGVDEVTDMLVWVGNGLAGSWRLGANVQGYLRASGILAGAYVY